MYIYKCIYKFVYVCVLYIYIFFLLLLLRSNRSRQHSKVLYRWGGGQEKRTDKKTLKSRSEEKVASFSSASLFPATKWEAVTQDGNRELDHLTQRKAQRAGIVKGWEEKRDCWRFPDTFT